MKIGQAEDGCEWLEDVESEGPEDACEFDAMALRLGRTEEEAIAAEGFGKRRLQVGVRCLAVTRRTISINSHPNVMA